GAMGVVGVASAYRRQGLGSRLAEEVERFASSNACRWVEAEVRERNLPVALPFIGPRGYVELERYRTSVQTPSTVDLRGLDDLRRRLEAEGIEIAAFPAIDFPRDRDEIFRSVLAIWRDMPHEGEGESEDPKADTM